MFIMFSLRAQENQIPLFKQVNLPGTPSVTSEYFFFSADGLMWFSTPQGLTSFDGSDLVVHSSLQQANQFALNRINSMVEDHLYNLYVGTPAGLYYYDRQNRSYRDILAAGASKRFSPHPGIAALYVDRGGCIYAGTASEGMLVYDPASTTLAHYNMDPAKPDNWQNRTLNTVCSFASHATDSNKLWIGSYHGIFLFDKLSKTWAKNFRIVTAISHKYSPFSADPERIDVQRMDVADDTTIWFNSWAGGFALYNTRSGQVTIPFGRDGLYRSKGVYYGYIIPKFVRLLPGKYLLGIYNGRTAVYDTRTGKAVYFSVADNTYTEEQTKFVDRDRQGNTWVLQRGLLYMSLPEAVRLQKVEVPNLTPVPFSRPDLRGIWFDSTSGMFYAAFLHSTGIHVYDTRFELQKVIPTSLVNNYYNYASSIDKQIVRDGSGRFWTTGWKMHVLLPARKRFALVEKVLPALSWLGAEDRFMGLAATGRGDVLVKGNDGTVYHINHLSLFTDTLHARATGTAGADIQLAGSWYDRNRDLVYLTGGKGMEQAALAGHSRRTVPLRSLLGDPALHHMHGKATLDAAGRIWCMIPEWGIRIVDPGSLDCVDSLAYGSRGLVRGGYTAITAGPGSYMLLRSQNGIVVYDYKKQQSFLFDHSNGLSSPDNKSLLYSYGHMFIGENNLFEHFKLADLDNYTAVVAPYLNKLMADTAAVLVRTGRQQPASIKLRYDQNTLSFQFSATEFFFPERIGYAYRLAGVDNGWQYTNSFNRKISYTQLKPGDYVFRLMAQREGGSWQGTPVAYTIRIVPAFWQTGLFKLLMALVTGSLVYLLYRRRIAQIRKQHARQTAHEKALLELEARALRAQMNPHFIFNSLNSIKSLINKNQNEQAAVYLTTFSKLIRTLFQHSDQREISLYEELETCRLYTQLEKMRFGEKVDFVFDIEEGIDLKDIKVPALVLQPFVENAIWHGLIPRERGGKLLVMVSRNNGTVECRIDDNGVGREVSAKYKTGLAARESKGIALTRSRLQLDKLLNNREDTLTIIDKRDGDNHPAGTTVIIRFSHPTHSL